MYSARQAYLVKWLFLHSGVYSQSYNSCLYPASHRQQTNPNYKNSLTWYSTQQSLWGGFLKLLEYWRGWLTIPPNTLITSFCCYLRGKNICVFVGRGDPLWRLSEERLAGANMRSGRDEAIVYEGKFLQQAESLGPACRKTRFCPSCSWWRKGWLDGWKWYRREEQFLFMDKFSTAGRPTQFVCLCHPAFKLVLYPRPASSLFSLSFFFLSGRDWVAPLISVGIDALPNTYFWLSKIR